MYAGGIGGRFVGKPSSISENSLRLTALRDIDSGGGGGSGSIIVTGSMGKSMNGIMLKLNGICNIGGGELDEVEGGNCWWKGDCNIGSGDVEDVA